MTVHTGKPNSTPRVLQSRSGAIQGAQRFFVPKLDNTVKNAVENASGQCPANRGTHSRRSGLARLIPIIHKDALGPALTH